MAVLEKIRNKSGLLIGIIGLALLAFILTDFVSGSGILFGRNMDVGEINGNSVSGQEFSEKLAQYEENYKNAQGSSTIDENTREQIVNQIWNEYIDKYVFDVQYQKSGIAVHPDELFDMIQGENIDPQVEQIPIFKDSVTQQFSRNRVLNFLKNQLTNEADPEGRMRKNWADFEQQLVKGRMKAKYANLIKKSVYFTSLQAKRDYSDKNNYADVRIISQRLEVIPDSTIKLTDADYKEFYAQRKHEFEQAEETRKIEYVVFTVAPSPQDREALVNSMEELKVEFANVSDDSLFVSVNSEQPFSNKYLTASEVPSSISDAVFAEGVGSLHGPWTEDNSVKIAKVLAFKAASDSVRARHILISTKDGVDIKNARKRADSLLAEVKKGQNFALLALQFSEDPGSKVKGGDLDWFTEGTMVPTFNDACFNGKVGDLVVVESDYGAHLINIQEKTKPKNKVKLGVIQKRIVPSSETEEKMYYNADEFAGNSSNYEDFKKLAEEKGYFLVPYDGLKISDRRINDLSESREMVRWVFDEKTKIGDVSKVFNIGENYVVASLLSLKAKGIPPLDQLKASIEPAVIKWRKTQILAEKFNKAAEGASTLEAIAEKLGLEVVNNDKITFSTYALPNHGNEPKVLGYSFGLSLNKISKAIEGNNAVFILQVVKTYEEGEKPENWEEKKKQMATNARYRIDGQLNQALTKKANITDNRARFF
jgi:peptidyl-prolyl cis-trans isomerase D